MEAPKRDRPFNIATMKYEMGIRKMLWNMAKIPIDKHRKGGKAKRSNILYSISNYAHYPKPDGVHDAKQGGYMERIKFKDFETVTQKGYAMIQINGTYIGGDKDGEPFSTRFFSSAKHLSGPVKDASAGDTLAITFKQNGRYKNAVAIKNETVEGTSGGDNPGAKAPIGQGSGAGQVVQVAAPQDTKYNDAKLATKFYLDARMAKVKPEDISEAFIEALQLADLVQDWRESKGAFVMGVASGIPGEEDLEDIPE
jgi:hypothetical protein